MRAIKLVNRFKASLRKIPETATRALAKVQQRLGEVDGQIAICEQKLHNAADHFRAADGEWDRLNRDWEAAQEAINNDVAARRRADSLVELGFAIALPFPAGLGLCLPDRLITSCCFCLRNPCSVPHSRATAA